MKNSMDIVFYGIGHSMVDYFAEGVPPKILESIREIHLGWDDFSKILQKISPKKKTTGGTTVNILKTASKLGGKCFYSGSIGTVNGEKDEDALFFQNEMEKYAIEYQLFSRKVPTGKFLSLRGENGENSKVVYVGAAKELEVPQVNEIRFSHSNCFVMEGMQFLNDGILEQVVDFCFRYNILLVVDCGSTFGAEAVGKKICDIGQSLDIILFANEEEATCLKKIVEKPEDNCLLYIEKKGSKGATAYFENQEVFVKGKILEAEYVRCEVGAGDAFAGSFLWKLLREVKNNILDLDLSIVKETLEFATEEASKILCNYGI